MEKKNGINFQIIDLRREHFITGLLAERYNRIGVKREATRIGIPTVGYRYVCFLAKGEEAPLTKAMIDAPGFVADTLSAFGLAYSLAMPHKTVLGVLGIEEENPDYREGIRAAAEQLRTRLKQVTEMGITVSFGDVVNDIYYLCKAYTSAEEMMTLRNYFGGNRVICMESLHDASPAPLYRMPRYKELLAAVKKRNINDARYVIKAIYDEATEKSQFLLPIDYKSLYLEAAVCISDALSDPVDATPYVHSKAVSFFEALVKVHNPESLRNELLLYVDTVFSLLENSGKSGRKLRISQAVDYIYRHLDERITLEQMANLCELSPSYFSKLFKSETGENFADFLTWCRIEKAISLMKDPKMKIYEISEQTGYSDVHYFNKVFRDLMGVSPSFYRNNMLIGQYGKKM